MAFSYWPSVTGLVYFKKYVNNLARPIYAARRCGACPTYITNRAAESATYLDRHLSKHGVAAAALGLELVEAAFTTYGGWGEEMLKKVRLEYELCKKAERKDGGSGWLTQRWKQELLQRASIAIARGNHAMLSLLAKVPAAAPLSGRGLNCGWKKAQFIYTDSTDTDTDRVPSHTSHEKTACSC